MTAAESVPTTECRRCETDVPAGNFCGLCGCDPSAEPGANPVWLRPNVFGAAPGESVLRPHLLSSLFPQLPGRSRAPFRAVVIIAAVALLMSVILRFPAQGIAIGALGLPLLFVLYLRASGVGRDLPRVSLAVAAVSSALLGTFWVLFTGHAIARNYGVPMAVGLALHHLLEAGLIIPTIGMLLTVVPTVIIRMLRPGSREALDGYAIGALGSLCFYAAVTLTRLAPQLFTGLIAHTRPIKGVLVEAVLCGVTVPITAAAAGGMIGAALWFTPSQPHHRRVRLVLWLLAGVALVINAAAAAVDIVGAPQLVMLAVHLGATVVVLLALRLVLQIAMLHEVHDPIQQDQPLLCVYCEHVVPDMAFCPACGAATRASSQQSRRERRGPFRPRRVDLSEGQLLRSPEGAPERAYTGMALPQGNYASAVVQRPRMSWLLGRWGTAIVAATAVLGGLALVLAPKIAHYACPPECGKPPTGMPVMELPRFTSADGAFSVSYPATGSAYAVTTQKSGVTAKYTGGEGGVLQLFSEPANGRSARDIAKALVRRTYPDAKTAYAIPNAMVGYQPGYGELVDNWPQSSTASYARDRILVMVAVKNDLALVAFATGPYHAFGPDFGPGPPSGANFELAQDLGKYINSFHWNGDPIR